MDGEVLICEWKTGNCVVDILLCLRRTTLMFVLNCELNRLEVASKGFADIMGLFLGGEYFVVQLVQEHRRCGLFNFYLIVLRFLSVLQ